MPFNSALLVLLFHAVFAFILAKGVEHFGGFAALETFSAYFVALCWKKTYDMHSYLYSYTENPDEMEKRMRKMLFKKGDTDANS